MDFLYKVRKGIIYCPKTTDDTHGRVCYSVPPKAVLLEKLIITFTNLHSSNQMSPQLVPQVDNLMKALQEREANSEWYCTLLAIFDPDNEIFAKSWRYIRPKLVPEAQVVFENDDDLFTDLPPLTEKEVRSTKRLRVPKEQKAAIRLA